MEGIIPFDAEYWGENLGKYRLSAAAVAIHCLRSVLSPTARRQVCRIVLNEDRDAVGFASCHARGLIPFCADNPLLRIERRVSVWRNLFCWTWHDGGDWHDRVDVPLDSRWGRLQPREVTEPVADWMVEAAALEQLGMPQGSFTLVLDGDPIPLRTSQVFHHVVQWDAANQGRSL